MDTLAFLASPEEQRSFAAKVHYDDYVGEFACWWFDSFLPDNPLSRGRYSAAEFEALVAFSASLDKHLAALPTRPRSIDELLAEPIWALVVREASRTLNSVSSSA